MAVSYRVALRTDDIPLGEQTVAQVIPLIFLFIYLIRNVLPTSFFWFVIHPPMS